MLFLTRLQNTSVQIGDTITVTVLEVTPLRVTTAVTLRGNTTIRRTAIGERLELTDNINILMNLNAYNQAQLGITAPKHIPVHRTEVLARIMASIRQLSIYEICATPKARQMPSVHSYIVAQNQNEALAHFTRQHDNDWLIQPWVVTTHWQPELMEFVDAGMDNSETYRTLRTACLLRRTPFTIILPHLNNTEAAA